MDTAQIEKLKALALAASPGPWQWWTSNSTLRLTGADGRDGGVLYGYVHSGDGDVYCSEPNRAFIEASNPATVLELIAENERRNDELSRLRDWFESQRKAISKGAGSTWDMCQCLDQIARIDAAIGAHQSRNRKGTQ